MTHKFMKRLSEVFSSVAYNLASGHCNHLQFWKFSMTVHPHKSPIALAIMSPCPQVLVPCFLSKNVSVGANLYEWNHSLCYLYPPSFLKHNAHRPVPMAACAQQSFLLMAEF